MTTTMGKRPWFGPFLLLICLIAGSCVVVRHGEERADTDEVSAHADFDASAYVAEQWEAKILPDLTAHAVDLPKVLLALAADPDMARSTFGHRSEETAPFNFVVRGQANVASVDLESSASTAVLDFTGVNRGTVSLQIGPVIRTSAVRDALTFVRFGDFTNQVDFANLSRALNTRVRDQVVSAIDRESLVGKTLRFTAAFTEDPTGRVLLTPVVLEVVP